MISLTEEMVLTKSKSKDLKSVKKLSCWASNLNDVSILKGKSLQDNMGNLVVFFRRYLTGKMIKCIRDL